MQTLEAPFLVGIILALQAACVTPEYRQHNDLHDLSGGLKVGDIVETSTGEVIARDRLMAELAAVKIVYVGETHTSAEDHRVQLQVMKGLYAQNPSLVLALEMFPREAQPLLDEYAQGVISEEEFLKKVKWKENWGYPFELYRSLLTWAKDHQIRIVGLNAPREIVSKIAQSGLSSLTTSERNRVAQDFSIRRPEARRIYSSAISPAPQRQYHGFQHLP